MAFSWLKQGVIDWFFHRLIDSLMETLLYCLYFVGRCVVKNAKIKDTPKSNCLPVFYYRCLLGRTFCTKRGQSALGQDVPWGHSALGQTVPRGHPALGQNAIWKEGKSALLQWSHALSPTSENSLFQQPHP